MGSTGLLVPDPSAPSHGGAPHGSDSPHPESPFNRLQIIKEEILHLVDAQMHGVVVGILDREGSVDVAAMTQIAAACKKEQIDLTFHRAFDMTQDMRSG